MEGRKEKGEEMIKKRKVLAGKTKKKVMPCEKSRLTNRNEKSVSKEIDV